MTHPAISVPTLIAHRGYSAAAPENTLAAVRAAHQAGATWVELDVQLLKDDTPVIWHDGDVRRCSDGRGELANLTWQQAQQLDVGSWFGDRFAGEKMASLEAMLALLNELEMGVNLEIKVNKGRDPIIRNALATHLIEGSRVEEIHDRCNEMTGLRLLKVIDEADLCRWSTA